MKIKNRKCELRQIAVPMIGKTLKIIHVTPKQLEKLNAIPIGKEVFLSLYYCQIGGTFRLFGPRTAFNTYPIHTGHWRVTRLSSRRCWCPSDFTHQHVARKHRLRIRLLVGCYGKLNLRGNHLQLHSWVFLQSHMHGLPQSSSSGCCACSSVPDPGQWHAHPNPTESY